MNAQFTEPPSTEGRRAGDEGATQSLEQTIGGDVAEILEN